MTGSTFDGILYNMSSENDQVDEKDEELEEALELARARGQRAGLSKDGIGERRRKVSILRRAGMTAEDIAQLLTEEGQYGELVITPSIIQNDLKKLERIYTMRIKEFEHDREVGKAVADYEYLIEQAWVEFHNAPKSSTQKQQFLKLAKDGLESKQKFFQTVGLVERVASQTVVTHKNLAISNMSPEHLAAMTDIMIKAAMEHSGKAGRPQLDSPDEDEDIIEGEFEEEDESS